MNELNKTVCKVLAEFIDDCELNELNNCAGVDDNRDAMIDRFGHGWSTNVQRYIEESFMHRIDDDKTSRACAHAIWEHMMFGDYPEGWDEYQSDKGKQTEANSEAEQRDNNINRLNDLLGDYKYERDPNGNVDGLIVQEAAKLYAEAIAREREKRGLTISTPYGYEDNDLEYAERVLYQAIEGRADMPESVEDFAAWASVDIDNEATE